MATPHRVDNVIYKRRRRRNWCLIRRETMDWVVNVGYETDDDLSRQTKDKATEKVTPNTPGGEVWRWNRSEMPWQRMTLSRIWSLIFREQSIDDGWRRNYWTWAVGLRTLEWGDIMYTRQMKGTSGMQPIHMDTFFSVPIDCMKPISGPYQMLVRCCWQFGWATN